MTVDIINRTIRAMCLEIETQASATQNWKMMTEEEFLYEAAICIFSSQMIFETAVATADRLREKKLLQPPQHVRSGQAIERKVVEALADRLPVPGCDGTLRWVRPRLKNRQASLLAKTIIEIYGQSRTIRGFLSAAGNAREAREILMQHVWGFGPKQASLFLRRVGYCADLAVLDVHVLDYLQLARGLSLTPSKLGRLSLYEEIENTFQEIAAEFGHSMGCVDLATWLTMRVAKKEALL
jgi:N-glycosylase/DNA lyase